MLSSKTEGADVEREDVISGRDMIFTKGNMTYHCRLSWHAFI